MSGLENRELWAPWMLREYGVQPWMMPDYFPSEINAIVSDLEAVQAAMKKAQRG